MGIGITVFFVNNIPAEWLADQESSSDSTRTKVCEAAGATAKLIAHPDMLLLIPLCMFSGLVETFYIANFNEVGQLVFRDGLVYVYIAIQLRQYVVL